MELPLVQINCPGVQGNFVTSVLNLLVGVLKLPKERAGLTCKELANPKAIPLQQGPLEQASLNRQADSLTDEINGPGVKSLPGRKNR